MLLEHPDVFDCCSKLSSIARKLNLRKLNTHQLHVTSVFARDGDQGHTRTMSNLSFGSVVSEMSGSTNSWIERFQARIMNIILSIGLMLSLLRFYILTTLIFNCTIVLILFKRCARLNILHTFVIQFTISHICIYKFI